MDEKLDEKKILMKVGQAAYKAARREYLKEIDRLVKVGGQELLISRLWVQFLERCE